MAKDKGKEFKGPRGICVCGHTGEGADSEHADFLLNGADTDPGKGQCMMCDCEQYSWKRWTRKYQNFLAGLKSR